MRGNNMSDNAFGLIEKIEVQGPFEGKNGKPDFDRLTFTVGGKKYTKLTNVGVGTELNEGDNVHVFFNSTQNGKFTNNNIIKIELSDKQASSTGSSTATKKSTASTASASRTTTTASSQTTTKDISMEVSGLLQALIHSGGVRDTLEDELRQVLQLKRRVAQELEAKGTV
jgi:hypothetical protein